MFDWDDLKPFLAVARQGSTIAAARILGIDQSTVQRRLGALERGIGYPLVRRLPTGYRLTAFGESLLVEAQRVEEAVLALQQRIEAFQHDLAGIVRVTCPEPLVFRMATAGLLDRFHERYPAIDVQFVMSDKYVDLERGEADVAVRAGETPDSALVARRIGMSLWGVYASRRYVELRGRPTCVADLERHPLIGFDDTLSQHRAAGWLREVAPKARFVARNDSIPVSYTHLDVYKRQVLRLAGSFRRLRAGAGHPLLEELSVWLERRANRSLEALHAVFVVESNEQLVVPGQIHHPGCAGITAPDGP